MLAHRHDGMATGKVVLAGLGSNCGLQPYRETLVRGYGWGRVIDLDDPFLPNAKPVAVDFDREARLLTRSLRHKCWN
jgi:hypothetical protein